VSDDYECPINVPRRGDGDSLLEGALLAGPLTFDSVDVEWPGVNVMPQTPTFEKNCLSRISLILFFIQLANQLSLFHSFFTTILHHVALHLRP